MSEHIEGYNGIYLERSGKDALAMVEKLLSEPEQPLTKTQRQEVYDFEIEIDHHPIDGIDGGPKTVEDILKEGRSEDYVAPKFFAEAFIDKSLDLSAITDTPPDFSDASEVYAWLADAVNNTDEKSERAMIDLAAASRSYYKKKMAKALVDNTRPADLSLDYMPIVLDPRGSIDRVARIQNIRHLLHQYRDIYKEGGDRVDGAKRSLVDVYLSKVNSIAVDGFVVMSYLFEQANILGNDSLARSAEEAISSNIMAALKSRRLDNLRRFDYLANGKGTDHNNKDTAVDEAVMTGAAYSNNEARSDGMDPPIFDGQEAQKLKSYMLTSEEMVKFYSRVLSRAGLLSSEDANTWSSGRTTRAADGLFQVIPNHQNKESFAVNGKTGVLQVPQIDRSLYDVIIIGGAHELEHVNQSQADIEIGETIRLARSKKGKRSTPLRESGADFKQRQAERLLFGEAKPYSLAYANAIRVVESGGDLFAATKAFYDEKCWLSSSGDQSKLALESADRTLRVFRRGFSSGSMAYAEEAILDQELSDAPAELQRRAGLVTSFDLVDQVRLHKYGLLPDISDSSVDWLPLVLQEASLYIDAAINTRM